LGVPTYIHMTTIHIIIRTKDKIKIMGYFLVNEAACVVGGFFFLCCVLKWRDRVVLFFFPLVLRWSSLVDIWTLKRRFCDCDIFILYLI
jgi:hypothetical protein